VIMLVMWLCACDPGLELRNDKCPGGLNCWCPGDTAHEILPPLDENGHIICNDTGDNE